MKKSIFGKIGAAAVVLTLVTGSLVGGTFAKYVTNVNAKATATAAKWDVVFKKGENAIQNDEAITLVAGESKVGRADGKIIPGDKGSIVIDINGKDAEVGFKYKITLSDPTGDLSGIKFYKDNTYDEAQELNPVDYEKTIEYSKTGEDMNDTVTLYWELPNNENDTALAGKTITYKVSMIAEQLTEIPASTEPAA